MYPRFLAPMNVCSRSQREYYIIRTKEQKVHWYAKSVTYSMGMVRTFVVVSYC